MSKNMKLQEQYIQELRAAWQTYRDATRESQGSPENERYLNVAFIAGMQWLLHRIFDSELELDRQALESASDSVVVELFAQLEVASSPAADEQPAKSGKYVWMVSLSSFPTPAAQVSPWPASGQYYVVAKTAKAAMQLIRNEYYSGLPLDLFEKRYCAFIVRVADDAILEGYDQQGSPAHAAHPSSTKMTARKWAASGNIFVRKAGEHGV